MKRSTLEFIRRAVTSAVSARNVVRLVLVALTASAAQTLHATDTFTESWNLMRQDEQTQGTPGSYLGEIRRRQDGLPVADRFLLEESELQSEADSAVLPVPDARASRLFQEDAGRWIGVSASDPQDCHEFCLSGPSGRLAQAPPSDSTARPVGWHHRV